MSSDESSSVINDNTSSDETTTVTAAKEHVDFLNCKKDQNLHLQFTNSSVILTSEDEGLGHDDSSRRLYRSEEDGYSGPSSLDSSEKKLKMIKNELNSNDKKSDKLKNVVLIDRCTSPLMNVNDLELKLGKLEKENNELIEQNLELEEAENDARLVSQKLKIKVDNLLEQIDNLQMNLEQSQEYIKTNQDELNEFKKREDKLIEQIKELQTKLDEERNISLSTINSSDEDWPINRDKLSKLNSLSNCSNNNHNEQQNNNPICNSIKPVKIDLCSNLNNFDNYEQMMLNDSSDNQTNNSQINNELIQYSVDQPHSIDKHLKALETNQEELNDRLKHLQTVNREFVKDLEQREHLLARKELLFQEWITKENLLRRSLAELNSELDDLNKQYSVSQRQRAELRAKCEELHLQLTELEQGNVDNLRDNSKELPLITRQKELHELIVSCKQQEYDHRLIELINKFKSQFDDYCTKEMQRHEQTQIILDKFFAQEVIREEEMRNIMIKKNDLKEQIYKQQKNLEKVSLEFFRN